MGKETLTPWITAAHLVAQADVASSVHKKSVEKLDVRLIQQLNALGFADGRAYVLGSDGHFGYAFIVRSDYLSALPSEQIMLARASGKSPMAQDALSKALGHAEVPMNWVSAALVQPRSYLALYQGLHEQRVHTGDFVAELGHVPRDTALERSWSVYQPDVAINATSMAAAVWGLLSAGSPSEALRIQQTQRTNVSLDIAALEERVKEVPFALQKRRQPITYVAA